MAGQGGRQVCTGVGEALLVGDAPGAQAGRQVCAGAGLGEAAALSVEVGAGLVAEGIATQVVVGLGGGVGVVGAGGAVVEVVGDPGTVCAGT